MVLSISKSPNILGFLRSNPTTIVLILLKANTEAMLIAQKVFPSPLTEEVIKTVFAPFIPLFL